MRLLVALVVWIGAVVGAGAVSSVVANSIRQPAAVAAGTSASGSGSSSSGGAATSGSSVDPSSIRAADRTSLFHTPNFARVLAVARSRLGPAAKVTNFVVYPGYLSATATSGSGEVALYASATGTVNVTTSGGGAPGSGFRLDRVKSTDPATLARRIAAAAHIPESQLHYMVADMDAASGGFRWLVYTVSGSKVEYLQAAGVNGQLLEYRTNSSTGLQPATP